MQGGEAHSQAQPEHQELVSFSYSITAQDQVEHDPLILCLRLQWTGMLTLPTSPVHGLTVQGLVILACCELSERLA